MKLHHWLKISCIVLAIGFLVPNVSAQGKLELKGDKMYADFDFIGASNTYEKAFEKLSKKDDKSKEERAEYARLAGKIADCHMLIHNYAEAEKWYAQTIKLGNPDPQMKFYYAQALRSNGKYGEAETAYKEYLDTAPDDPDAQAVVKEFETVARLQEDKGTYKVRPMTNANSKASEYSPAFFMDKVVFVSNQDRKGLVKNSDIWTGKEEFFQLFISDVNRGSKDLAEPDIFRKAGVNGRFHEGPVSFDKTRGEMYFTRSNYQTKKPTKDSMEIVHLKIFKIKLNRQGENMSWPTEAFPYNSDNYSCGHPAVSNDGQTMIFMSDMPGGQGETDLWMVRKAEGSNSWEQPVNMGSMINTNRREMFPYLDRHNNLWFASEGHPGLGGLDMYRCLFNHGKWEEPENMGTPLNGPKDDFGLIIDGQDDYGYFASNRNNKFFDDDLYGFKVEKKEECFIAGTSRDRKTGDILPNAEIFLIDTLGGIADQTTSDDMGLYHFIVAPGSRYIISGSAKEYVDGENTVTINEDCEIETIEKEPIDVPDSIKPQLGTDLVVDVELDKFEGIVLKGVVTDAQTGKPLPLTVVTIIDEETGVEAELVAEKGGEWEYLIDDKKVGDVLAYEIRYYKDKYLPERHKFSESIKGPGVIRVEEDLEPIKVPMLLNDLLAINPIYFDLDKYNIRPDAAAELDKIVQVMQDYPTMVIELSSHTDCRASEEYNKTLSTNRAISSKDYIVSQDGIEQERIYGRGYGESKLATDCPCEGNSGKGLKCTEEQHQLNRRTEFLIMKL